MFQMYNCMGFAAFLYLERFAAKCFLEAAPGTGRDTFVTLIRVSLFPFTIYPSLQPSYVVGGPTVLLFLPMACMRMKEPGIANDVKGPVTLRKQLCNLVLKHGRKHRIGTLCHVCEACCWTKQTCFPTCYC